MPSSLCPNIKDRCLKVPTKLPVVPSDLSNLCKLIGQAFRKSRTKSSDQEAFRVCWDTDSLPRATRSWNMELDDLCLVSFFSRLWHVQTFWLLNAGSQQFQGLLRTRPTLHCADSPSGMWGFRLGKLQVRLDWKVEVLFTRCALYLSPLPHGR